MHNTVNFLLAGVGGQGTILASDVLVNVGLAAGLRPSRPRSTGCRSAAGASPAMSAGGSRCSPPIAGAGEVDVLLAFEKAEAMRVLNQLRPGALIVINTLAIRPVTVTSGGQVYPDDERLHAAVSQVTPRAVYVNGAGIAESLGNIRVANVVLLPVEGLRLQ